MGLNFLDFEQPIIDIETQIEDLRQVGNNTKIDLSDKIERLERDRIKLARSIFSQLTPWQVVQLARHSHRPRFLDYIEHIFDHFDELHGDRQFADDRAIIGGLAYLGTEPVMVIGQHKGRNTVERAACNFGMPKPEGYRKALRLMQLAERFRLPVLTFIDTPGADPGVASEERNQSGALAANLQAMSQLNVPVIATVIGEGGSGGALAIGVADRLLMLQYSVYSVISPEGCASIIWGNKEKSFAASVDQAAKTVVNHAAEAAAIMAMTADRLLDLKLVDQVIEEPLGGAHRNPAEMMRRLKTVLLEQYAQLRQEDPQSRLEKRYQRLISLGL